MKNLIICMNKFIFHYVNDAWSSMRKTFLCTSMTNLFRTRIRTLLFTSHGLYTNPTYIQRFFIFPNTHLWFTQRFLHVHSLLTHTKESQFSYSNVVILLPRTRVRNHNRYQPHGTKIARGEFIIKEINSKIK